MDTYLVKGLDRNTGEPRSITPEVASERAAMDAGFEAGMVIESIRKLPKTRVIGEKAVLQPPPSMETNKPSRPKTRLSLPFLGQRGNYEERGVNTVGEIAAGVFMGLLLFSCASPIIFLVIASFYWVWLASR